MEEKKINVTQIVLGLVVLAGAGFAAVTFLQDEIRVYPAKFACGIMPTATSTGSVGDAFFRAVNPGRYTSSINIENMGTRNADLMKRVNLAPREPAYGTTTASVTMSLPGRSATSADCPDIYSLMGMSASSTAYIEGFLNVVSKTDLYVVAVYTGQSLSSNGSPLEMSTMDVEEIAGKALPR